MTLSRYTDTEHEGCQPNEHQMAEAALDPAKTNTSYFERLTTYASCQELVHAGQDAAFKSRSAYDKA